MLTNILFLEDLRVQHSAKLKRRRMHGYINYLQITEMNTLSNESFTCNQNSNENSLHDENKPRVNNCLHVVNVTLAKHTVSFLCLRHIYMIKQRT